MRLLASSNILFTASTDSIRTYSMHSKIRSNNATKYFLNNWKPNHKYKIKSKLHALIKQTFQSGLSKLFKRVWVIFPLMSSRGKPSSPPATTDEDESEVLTVLLVTTDAPWSSWNYMTTLGKPRRNVQLTSPNTTYLKRILLILRIKGTKQCRLYISKKPFNVCKKRKLRAFKTYLRRKYETQIYLDQQIYAKHPRA